MNRYALHSVCLRHLVEPSHDRLVLVFADYEESRPCLIIRCIYPPASCKCCIYILQMSFYPPHLCIDECQFHLRILVTDLQNIWQTFCCRCACMLGLMDVFFFFFSVAVFT